MQKNVLEYLEAAAERCPDKPAFIGEEEMFTFAGLRETARRMGTALLACTVRRNAPVCVLTDRSAGCLAAFMGVLYSGNFYVPLDGQMPRSRLRGILQALHPIAMIYPAALEARAAEADEMACPRLSFPDGFAHPIDENALTHRRAGVLDADPVYAIFTSGSTGTPKGIVIRHRSVIDFVDWMAEAGAFSDRDVLGNQAPFYFDLSVKDIYLTLKCAATCCIIPKKLFLFPLPLLKFLEEKNVTALVWATSAFHLLANSGALEKAAPARLRTVIVGGEALQAKQLNVWRRALPHVRYINLYGPTEVTVDCTWYPIEREFSDTERIPIGRACANKEVFLLDENRRPVPAGTVGEICVRGTGLACGYYGQWEKTRESFIQDPRNPYYPDWIYCTGDMAVMDANGVLTFLSRRDGQVKHMGYRVELGEIEATLNSVPFVREAVCLYDGARDKILCIYTGEEDGQALARTARELLPRYMVPNIYHRRDAMPHTSNGKLHRVRLREEYIDGNRSGS